MKKPVSKKDAGDAVTKKILGLVDEYARIPGDLHGVQGILMGLLMGVGKTAFNDKERRQLKQEIQSLERAGILIKKMNLMILLAGIHPDAIKIDIVENPNYKPKSKTKKKTV